MSITRILDFEMVGFVYALMVVVAFQLLTGRIRTNGLMLSKDGSGQVSPERVQLLLATIAAGTRLLADIASSQSNKLDVDSSWLYLMGGSSSIYMVGKIWKAWNLKNRQQGG